MGNFVPWQDAAWAVLSERAGVLAAQCTTAAGRDGAPAAAGAAAECAAGIQAKLVTQVPPDLRPRP